GAAAATGVATVIWPPLHAPMQVVVFVATAIVATFLGRRYLPPASHGKGDINDPTPRLIGQRGEAAAAFKAGLGRVFVDGQEWAAELAGGGGPAAKSKVEVVGRLRGA